MSEYKGVYALRSKLLSKQTRIRKRYAHYEMKHIARDFRISTPPELVGWMSTLGWCGKAVDSLADRLQFRTFKNDNFDINEIYGNNNQDILIDAANTAAAICSCGFIYIEPDAEGYPRMQVLDGAHATGVIDPITNMLVEGYAILETDDYDNPIKEAYLLPGRTDIYYNSKLLDVIEHKAPYALLVPIILRPDAKRRFGHSRISRACMNIVDSAVRTIKRSEIGAEFFSFPQRYITGLDPNAEMIEKWKATMSTLLTIAAGENGEKPDIGQFAQQAMTPHLDQLRMFASLFAGETGLTLDDLGFPTENPSSAEAIKAGHENLRLIARKAQRTFGAGYLNAGYLSACVRDDYEFRRELLYETVPVWEPVFEPDAAMLGAIGDGIYKINEAMPGYIKEDDMHSLTGL